MNLLLIASATKVNLLIAHDFSSISILRNDVYNFHCNIGTQFNEYHINASNFESVNSHHHSYVNIKQVVAL